MKRLFTLLLSAALFMIACEPVTYEGNDNQTPPSTEQPGDEPNNPGEPSQPDNPSEPNDPSQPDNPSEPDDPSQPDDPNTITSRDELPIALPEDKEPANTKFNHRALIVDHTGVDCSNCPRVMDGLLLLAESEWGSHYHEVGCHAGKYAPADGDNAYSDDATTLNRYYKVSSYPNIQINFHYGNGNINGGSAFVMGNGDHLAKIIKKNGADAGITASAICLPTEVKLAIGVKAAVTQEYKVTAWLLENNISNPYQVGASQPHHIVSNHALRKIAGIFSASDISGESMGVIEAGKEGYYTFNIPYKSSWVVSNMEILVIVSAPNGSRKFEVVNTALCPVIGGVEYEYLK